MKNMNKIASLFSIAALGLVSLTGCEGGDIYTIDSPDWLASRIDSIANANQGGEEEIEGLLEDVYTIGNTDYSTGWWAQFSKYYVIPKGQKLVCQFNLNINPDATNTYKNFAMIITNDDARGGGDYKEYGAIRFDHQPSGNSEWGDLWINSRRDLVTSSLTFATDTDNGVDKLGGKVTVTVDRANDGLYVEMNNGTVVKKYVQDEVLANLNTDTSNENIRIFFVPEGSYIDFLGTTIEPIGGLTSREDKQPLSMTLKGVPGKVLQGTSLDSAMASVTAIVQFEQEVTKTIPASELTFDVIPDMETLGTKTLIAVYNKTFKGESTSPVIGKATFQVVDKLFTSIGESSCTTPFWEAHSANIKVEPGETYVTTFTNYTSGASNWNNFVVVLDSEDGSKEYAVVRADNYGWGDGYAACTLSRTESDWATWLAAMNGAKVTLYVTNVGDGTANIQAVMLGNDGETYTQDYIGINTVDPENCYFNLTIDNSYIVFDYVVGAEDNSSAFWGAHSDNLKVEPGMTLTQSFVNHTSGNSNWNNFVVVLDSEDTTTEYAVVRADNYGWGNGYEGCILSGGQSDWAAWLSAMDGAVVTVSVTNNAESGTADVKCIMLGTDGETYYQDYLNITVTDPDNLFVRMTVDGCHMIWDDVVAR